jgi:adenylate cyclase
MPDTPYSLPVFSKRDLPARMSKADVQANRFTEGTLERHKREGLELAIRARWVALAAIALMLPFLNPRIEMLYYEALLLLLALNGWALRRVGRVGRSGPELALIFVDLALMTFALVFPNPFSVNEWPDAMTYRFGNFIYFFVILASGTLAYSWRTIMALGNWTAALWLIGLGLLWWFGSVDPELTVATQTAFGSIPDMVQLLDPNSLNFDIRAQEAVVFVICAYTLALTVRRFNRLLLGNAALERERANLSRYFSPNVVEELSQNDEPLKQIRSQGVAVMFVDIVGFTEFASERKPDSVIATLREFHALMETEIFANGGTLDKFLGDGLMATFGTPIAGKQDATNAMRCARAMMQSLDRWNKLRTAAGDPVIEARFGLHHGEVVLGDIGVDRLEFAVIGNTVNVASRLEALTRPLGVRLAASHAIVQRVKSEGSAEDACLSDLENNGTHRIRGVKRDLTVWSLS